MDPFGSRSQPYSLKAGEGWTYRFGIDFTVKAGEVQEGSGAAFLEYVTRRGEEPGDHTHQTEDEMFYVADEAAEAFHAVGYGRTPLARNPAYDWRTRRMNPLMCANYVIIMSRLNIL